MIRFTPDEVGQMLSRAGLDASKFDCSAISQDLTERATLNSTLTELIKNDDFNPIFFDPSWDK